MAIGHGVFKVPSDRYGTADAKGTGNNCRFALLLAGGPWRCTDPYHVISCHHALQVAVNEFTKMKYFKQCKFFDFCEDSLLKRLCMRLHQANYFTGDIIVHFGDLGQEMYFVASGSVEVVSTDLKTVLARIDNGGFFGETGLVYRTRRTANIRAATICTCYVLTKEEFDSELQGYNIAEEAPQQALNR